MTHCSSITGFIGLRYQHRYWYLQFPAFTWYWLILKCAVWQLYDDKRWEKNRTWNQNLQSKTGSNRLGYFGKCSFFLGGDFHLHINCVLGQWKWSFWRKKKRPQKRLLGWRFSETLYIPRNPKQRFCCTRCTLYLFFSSHRTVLLFIGFW